VVSVMFQCAPVLKYTICHVSARSPVFNAMFEHEMEERKHVSKTHLHWSVHVTLCLSKDILSETHYSGFAVCLDWF